MYRRRFLALAAAVAVYGVAWACSESLPEGRACPALCPDQGVEIVDTTIDGLTALSVDTTITGYPLLGQEPEMLIAAEGDSIDIRTVIRFDSITTYFRPLSTDTLQPATAVYRPYLRLTFDTLSFRPQGAGAPLPTIYIYDVDTAGSDTSVSVLASLFRPDRLLATYQVSVPIPGSYGLTDTVEIPISNTARVLSHITGDQNIRVGIRYARTGVAPPAGRLDILTEASGLPPVFGYELDTDTTDVPPEVAEPKSTTPTNDSALAADLLYYPLIVSGTSPPLGEHLDVGGMPSRRIFVQFVLPTRIIDSSTVVRATLTLHLIPNSLHGFFTTPVPDSLGILAEGIISTPAVTDPGHEAGFNAASSVIGIDTSYYDPRYPDSVNVEFVNAARHWHDRATDTVTRAIVLMGTDEGASPLAASFYPALPSVPAALRPHVHLAYVKTIQLSVP